MVKESRKRRQSTAVQLSKRGLLPDCNFKDKRKKASRGNPRKDGTAWDFIGRIKHQAKSLLDTISHGLGQVQQEQHVQQQIGSDTCAYDQFVGAQPNDKERSMSVNRLLLKVRDTSEKMLVSDVKDRSGLYSELEATVNTLSKVNSQRSGDGDVSVNPNTPKQSSPPTVGDKPLYERSFRYLAPLTTIQENPNTPQQSSSTTDSSMQSHTTSFRFFPTRAVRTSILVDPNTQQQSYPPTRGCPRMPQLEQGTDKKSTNDVSALELYEWARNMIADNKLRTFGEYYNKIRRKLYSSRAGIRESTGLDLELLKNTLSKLEAEHETCNKFRSYYFSGYYENLGLTDLFE